MDEFNCEKIKLGEEYEVTSGVFCQTYTFLNTTEKDLAMISIAPYKYTPPQKVLLGEKTIEGYISGNGILTIIIGSNTDTHIFNDGDQSQFFEVPIGATMQWKAGDQGLEVYEICYPPYEEGRFQNL